MGVGPPPHFGVPRAARAPPLRRQRRTRLPQPQRGVVGGGHQRLAVRREGQAADLSRVRRRHGAHGAAGQREHVQLARRAAAGRQRAVGRQRQRAQLARALTGRLEDLWGVCEARDGSRSQAWAWRGMQVVPPQVRPALTASADTPAAPPPRSLPLGVPARVGLPPPSPPPPAAAAPALASVGRSSSQRRSVCELSAVSRRRPSGEKARPVTLNRWSVRPAARPPEWPSHSRTRPDAVASRHEPGSGQNATANTPSRWPSSTHCAEGGAWRERAAVRLGTRQGRTWQHRQCPVPACAADPARPTASPAPRPPHLQRARRGVPQPHHGVALRRGGQQRAVGREGQAGGGEGGQGGSGRDRDESGAGRAGGATPAAVLLRGPVCPVWRSSCRAALTPSRRAPPLAAREDGPRVSRELAALRAVVRVPHAHRLVPAGRRGGGGGGIRVLCPFPPVVPPRSCADPPLRTCPRLPAASRPG